VLVDVDAAGVEQVGAQGKVDAAGRLTGVGEDGTRARRNASRWAGSTWIVPETMIAIRRR
jgi:hypothetical protein